MEYVTQNKKTDRSQRNIYSSSWKKNKLGCKQPFSTLAVVFLLTIFLDSSVSHKYIPEFNDKLAFEISWHGSEIQEHMLKDRHSVIINTIEKEKYQCFLPRLNADDDDGESQYGGIPAEELLSDLLSQKAKCSYRLEPYWTYEVCHGLHVRQFHEEKGVGTEKVKLQEYYLGRSAVDHEPASSKPDKTEKDRKKKKPVIEKVQTRLIDGRETPYFNVSFGNGTPCDIGNDRARHVSIMYICHETSNNQIVSVKETTTCEYEVMILTPELCRNPAYVIRENPVHDIKCLPLDGAPSRPKSMVEHETIAFEERAAVNIVHPPVNSLPDPEVYVGSSADPIPESEKENHALVNNVKISTTADEQLTKDFLNGDYCLQGGSGWWLYEFCNGKYVMQFHQEPLQASRTTIYLGFWHAEQHFEWMKTKKKSISKNYVTHYYSNGDVCDVTGKPRTAQVKLKCMEGQTGQQISIYMVEPSPCEYIVGIESPIFCPLVTTADSNGLFSKS